jgi:hypothetical protein
MDLELAAAAGGQKIGVHRLSLVANARHVADLGRLLLERRRELIQALTNGEECLVVGQGEMVHHQRALRVNAVWLTRMRQHQDRPNRTQRDGKRPQFPLLNAGGTRVDHPGKACGTGTTP